MFVYLHMYFKGSQIQIGSPGPQSLVPVPSQRESRLWKQYTPDIPESF